MAQFQDSHNRLCQAESGQASQQKAGEKEPREGGAGRDAGRMHTLNGIDKLGLSAPSIEYVAEPECCLWEHELSPAADVLGRYLAAHAERLSGEAFCWFGDVEATCSLDFDAVCIAIDELALRGAIISYDIHAGDQGLLLACVFDVDSDAYYGDDTNPPADLFDEGVLQGNEWTLPGYNYETDDFSDVLVDPKRARVYAKTGWRCFYCIEAPAEHLDHMHPRVRGGSDDEANLIGACCSCNSQKRDRTVEEYRAFLAYKQRLPDIRFVRFYGEASQ